MSSRAAEGAFPPERPTARGRASAGLPVGRGLQIALWSGLAFAFAPALQTGLSGFAAQPWTRGTLVFPILAWIAARSGPPATRSRGGWLLVLLGIGIELIAIGGGIDRASRLGFVVAAIGICRATGACTLPVALLLGFLLPLPHALMELSSPGLESGFARAAAAIAGGLGFDVMSGRGQLTAGSAMLRLSDADGGLGSFVLCAGLFGFVLLRAPTHSPTRWVHRASIAAAVAIAFQLLIVTLAALVLADGAADAPERARSILDHLPWLGIWAAGIVLGWRYRCVDGARPHGPIEGVA